MSLLLLFGGAAVVGEPEPEPEPEPIVIVDVLPTSAVFREATVSFRWEGPHALV